jgi:thiol:disulfide interchange protein DsbG
MNRRQFTQTGIAALAAFGLSACGRKSATQAPAAPALSAAQAYELAATANGFAVGPMMAANTAYVFFDTACPHCAVLWNSAKPLAAKLRMVWIPVGFLSQQSTPQGAAILVASNPAQAMDENEAKVLGGARSAPAAADAEAEKKVVANTEILKKLGDEGVPLIVYKQAKTGEYGSQSGQMDTPQLAALLGI